MPPSVPITPEAAPWTMKMPITERGVAPRVRRMAMSARLSVTVITSVDTRLNAATATISVRMMNIRRFSTWTAANQLRLVRVQSRTSNFGPRVSASSRATRGAWFRSSEAQLHAGRPFAAEQARGIVEVHQGHAAVVFVVAGIEAADDGERLEPRHDAGRRDLAAGQDDRHLVAFAHAQRAREIDAEDHAPGAGNEA